MWLGIFLPRSEVQFTQDFDLGHTKQINNVMMFTGRFIDWWHEKHNSGYNIKYKKIYQNNQQNAKAAINKE